MYSAPATGRFAVCAGAVLLGERGALMKRARAPRPTTALIDLFVWFVVVMSVYI